MKKSFRRIESLGFSGKATPKSQQFPIYTVFWLLPVEICPQYSSNPDLHGLAVLSAVTSCFRWWVWFGLRINPIRRRRIRKIKIFGTIPFRRRARRRLLAVLNQRPAAPCSASQLRCCGQPYESSNSVSLQSLWPLYPIRFSFTSLLCAYTDNTKLEWDPGPSHLKLESQTSTCHLSNGRLLLTGSPNLNAGTPKITRSWATESFFWYTLTLLQTNNVMEITFLYTPNEICLVSFEIYHSKSTIVARRLLFERKTLNILWSKVVMSPLIKLDVLITITVQIYIQNNPGALLIYESLLNPVYDKSIPVPSCNLVTSLKQYNIDHRSVAFSFEMPITKHFWQNLFTDGVCGCAVLICGLSLRLNTCSLGYSNRSYTITTFVMVETCIWNIRWPRKCIAMHLPLLFLQDLHKFINGYTQGINDPGNKTKGYNKSLWRGFSNLLIYRSLPAKKILQLRHCVEIKRTLSVEFFRPKQLICIHNRICNRCSFVSKKQKKELTKTTIRINFSCYNREEVMGSTKIGTKSPNHWKNSKIYRTNSNIVPTLIGCIIRKCVEIECPWQTFIYENIASVVGFFLQTQPFKSRTVFANYHYHMLISCFWYGDEHCDVKNFFLNSVKTRKTNRSAFTTMNKKKEFKKAPNYMKMINLGNNDGHLPSDPYSMFK